MLISFGASAEPIVGRGAYALLHANWNCTAFLRNVETLPVPSVSFLWHTFGHNLGCLERFAAIPAHKVVQVHIINTVCVRNGNCGPYEVGSGYSVASFARAIETREPRLLRRIRRTLKEAKRQLGPSIERPDVSLFVSPALEHNLTHRQFKLLAREVHSTFPTATIVNNPVNPAEPRPGFVFEQHGLFPREIVPGCVANLDGDIVAPTQFRQFVANWSHCSLIFLWHPQDNCRDGLQSFVDPRERRQCNEPDLYGREHFRLRRIYDHVCPRGVSSLNKLGMVWKQSDTPGRGAVLVHPGPLGSLKLYLRGKLVESAMYGGLGNPFHGVVREHWRFRTKAADLPRDILLKSESGDCLYISDPSKRLDGK